MVISDEMSVNGLNVCVCVFVISGATADSESSESCSVKRRLRRTRGELLFREYEVLGLEKWFEICSFP